VRRFELHRNEDVSGISGTGAIAEGVEFEDGTVAMRWKTSLRSTAVYEQGMEAIRSIHGHDGATVVYWIDVLNDPHIGWRPARRASVDEL
jgi:hypothetical protein